LVVLIPDDFHAIIERETDEVLGDASDGHLVLAVWQAERSVVEVSASGSDSTGHPLIRKALY
jgi:hypothetical protein